MALKQIVASGANQRSQKYGRAADLMKSGFNARSQSIFNPSSKKGSRMLILKVLAVMLNASSYIICRYQTEQSILKKNQRCSSGMRLSDLILIPPTSLKIEDPP